jgi:hypothetical protein
MSHPDARQITDIYMALWDIELFFKWNKQNLQLRSFQQIPSIFGA